MTRVFGEPRKTGPIKMSAHFPLLCQVNGSMFNTGVGLSSNETIFVFIKVLHEGLIVAMVGFVECLEGSHQVFD